MKLKWIGFVSLVIIALFGYGYTLVLMPKNASFFILLLLLVLIVVAIIQELKNEKTKEDVTIITKDSMYSFLFVTIGTLIPYMLSKYVGIHVVIGSAFVGLLFHFVIKRFEVEAYCGSFAGMIGVSVVGSYELLLVAAITGIIFVLAKPVWKGFGGKLGTIGFVGTITSIFILQKTFLAPILIEDEMLLVLFGVTGVVSTYTIQHHFKQTATFASSITSFIVGLITTYLFGLDPVYMTVFFAASFVGMADQTKINGIFTAGLAGFILSYIFIMFAPYLNGSGGKLGTMAFLTTLSVHGMNELIALSKKVSVK